MSDITQERIDTIKKEAKEFHKGLSPRDVIDELVVAAEELLFLKQILSDLKSDEARAYEMGRADEREVIAKYVETWGGSPRPHGRRAELAEEIRNREHTKEKPPKQVGSCFHCRERDEVAGDEEHRCQQCIDEGWVAGRRGWRQLGDFDG